tara:strand:- start:530 stop:1303 length:774 start_codon:yes stop_codon:yes gene_type:complete
VQSQQQVNDKEDSDSDSDDEHRAVVKSEEKALNCIFRHRKVGTILNALEDVKEAQYASYKDDFEPKVGVPDDWRTRLADVERALGQILARCLVYAEAAQVVNKSQLLRYTAKVLDAALKYSDLCESKHFGTSQEILALHYVYYVLHHMTNESYASKDIMVCVQDEALVTKIVMLLNVHGKRVSRDDALVACKALSYIFDTDEYLASKKRFVDTSLRRELVALEDSTIRSLVSDNRSLKRKLRPLLSQIMLFKKSMGK